MTRDLRGTGRAVIGRADLATTSRLLSPYGRVSSGGGTGDTDSRESACNCGSSGSARKARLLSGSCVRVGKTFRCNAFRDGWSEARAPEHGNRRRCPCWFGPFWSLHRGGRGPERQAARRVDPITAPHDCIASTAVRPSPFCGRRRVRARGWEMRAAVRCPNRLTGALPQRGRGTPCSMR